MANVRRIVAEFSARNKAKGQMAGFRSDLGKTGQAMRNIASASLALAGIGGFGFLVKSMIKAASSAEETQAKFDTVFKNLSGLANTWAESFGQSVGRAERDVKRWMAGLQDTFVPLGIAREEAFHLAKSLVTLAVDVASFNDAVDADVIRDFTSALVGNHETVRKFGIIISESALRQEAMRQGIEKTYKNLTDLEKVQLRYNLILSGTSDAQGDAARTSDSYANQVKRLYANIDDLKVSMGEELLPTFTDFVKIINENERAMVALSKAILAPAKSILYLIDIVRTLNELQKTSALPTRQRGGGWSRDPSPLLTVPELEISPWAMQQIAKMRAFQRKPDFMTTFPEVMKFEREPFSWEKAPQKITEEHRKAAVEVDKVWTEMWLEQEAKTYHAQRAPIIAAEEAARASAERRKRIAEDIALSMARSWTTAIDQMMFEGKKFWDTMKDMARGLAREIVNIILYKKLAEPIAYGIMGIPTAQHGGEVMKTGLAVIHKGETYSGEGQGDRGGSQTTEHRIINQGSEKLEISRVQEYLVSDRRILEVTIKGLQTNMELRRAVSQVRS